MSYMPSTPHETQMMIFWLLRKGNFRMVVGVTDRNAKTSTIVPRCR